MGFDDGKVVFDRENKTYFAGETVHGKLIFDQEKVKTFRGLYAKMKGYCKVHWTTRHSRRVDGRTEYYTVNHNSYETYFEQKVYLMGSDNGEVHLKPGHHEFPFQCHIPPHCPSSYRGRYGHISYDLKFVVDRSMKFDQEKVVEVDVVAQKDLNADPKNAEPLIFEMSESYCCWCMSSGVCDVEVRLPASGYVPGQTIHIDVKCNNKSSVQVDKVKLELKEEVRFRATNEPGTKTENSTIAKIKKGPIPANTTRNWIVEMELPEIDVRNVDTCAYIDVDYEFKVKLSTSGCHSDSGTSSNITIGHIPLRELEGPQKNPIQTQSVPLQRPIGSPFPPNPYPNSPYPGANSPYPGANPPYPGANSPYPGANSPYPPNAPPMENTPPMPHPTPMGNLSPVATAPNNGRVSPYPVANQPQSPYSGPNPTHHGATPPYPGANPPYPSATPPYPTGPSPVSKPSPVSIGFTMHHSPEDKSGATMPLLSPGNAPYPTSPYPNASAPEPASPDALKSTSPPYNPEFN